MAKLDEHLVTPELILRPFEVSEYDSGRGTTYGGNCISTPPSFPAARSGSRASWKRVEDLLTNLPRRMLHPPRAADVDVVAEIGRQLLEANRVAGHQPERLDMEHEPRRSALRPARGDLCGRQGVIRRVDLDRVESLRVVAQPLLTRADATRIPEGGERLVSERARADADRRGHDYRPAQLRATLAQVALEPLLCPGSRQDLLLWPKRARFFAARDSPQSASIRRIERRDARRLLRIVALGQVVPDLRPPLGQLAGAPPLIC